MIKMGKNSKEKRESALQTTIIDWRASEKELEGNSDKRDEVEGSKRICVYTSAEGVSNFCGAMKNSAVFPRSCIDSLSGQRPASS